MDYNTTGLLAKQTYGNGDYVDFSYDSFDRQTEKRYNGDNSQRVTYSYGNNGSVAQITDYFTNSNTRFTYDLAERVVSQREYSGTAKNGGELLSYTDFTYADKTNYLTGIKHFSPLGTQNIGYTYGNLKRGYMPDQVYGVSWNGANKLQNYYDGINRLVRKSYNGNKNFGMVYTYEDITVNNDQRTTTLVHSVETPTGTYTYEYDKLGNILSVTNGTFTTSYEYDSLNQLTRVNDEKAGKTYTYSYDNGNITSQSEYPYTVGDGVLDVPQTTKTWEYNDSTWGDLLTNFNGESITYDEIGNPLTIGSKELSWTGRQLQSITDGDTEIAYTYNGDGLRTSKTVNGETTNYYYNGSILAGQKSGDDTLVFMYDNNSDIFGVIYNDVEYYYIKNAQNDVIAIADADGSILVKYEYDAWGKVITVTDKDGNEITETTDEPTNASNDIDEEFVEEGLRALPQNNEDSVGVDALIDPSNADETTTVNETATVDESASLTSVDPQIAKIAKLNPILYRSYYYDKETEWYYLKSRYYSPDMCRFINADGIIQTGQGMLDKNMFAYCGNNPINRLDDNGNFWKSVKKCFSKTWSKVKSWARNTFGAGFTIENHFTTYEKENFGNYLSFFVTAKTGTKTKTTTYRKGNSSKPISVYAKGRSDNWLCSSAGLKVNINKLTVNLSLGLDDFGISGSYTNENAVNTFGIKIDVTQLKIGFECENSVKLNDNSYESYYSNASVTGLFLLATYCVLVGQDASQFFYQQQPAYN